MRRLILAVVLVLAASLFTVAPAHAVDTRTYSVRACNEHNRGTGRDVRICLKSYFFRQADGQGWTFNSVHVYAWTEGQGMGDCGESWDTPATEDGVVSIDNDVNADGLSWALNRNLSEGNRCDVFIRDDPLRRITSTGAEVAYTYNARIAVWPDPDGKEVLRIYLDPAAGGGFQGRCVANSSCEVDGPF